MQRRAVALEDFDLLVDRLTASRRYTGVNFEIVIVIGEHRDLGPITLLRTGAGQTFLMLEWPDGRPLDAIRLS